MEFLKDQAGTSTAEWLVAAALIIAVVGSIIYAVGDTAAAKGSDTDSWIDDIPAPTSP